MLRLPALAITLLGFTSFSAHAHDHSHHAHHNAAAHQHGLGHLDLVLEEQQLILELLIPAEDLLGFEHAPQTPEQKAQLDALQATLKQPEKLFALPAAAQCSLDTLELQSSLFAEPADPGDDAVAAHQHVDISAHYHFNCSSVEHLQQLQVVLFQSFPGSARLLLQAITPSGQYGGELSASSNQIDL